MSSYFAFCYQLLDGLQGKHELTSIFAATGSASRRLTAQRASLSKAPPMAQRSPFSQKRTWPRRKLGLNGKPPQMQLLQRSYIVLLF
jgi:hypothetical protein